MTNISFSENSEGYLIPLEDGKSLCDVADPTAQAEAWVNEQNLTIANEIVVLGLGAGFHIQQLQEAHPYLKIHVVECRDQLAPIYRKQIQSQLENYSCFHNLEELFASDVFEVTMRKSLPVYFLRQSWGSQEETFFSFWKSLTGRSAYSMARHFANLGLEVDDESLSLLKNTDRPLTIKDATDIIIQSKGPKAQEQRNYFEALRELVK
ncbi:MAG: hypothetical protein EOP06_06065 [Proteobacteria bacterium]|nr:MAG: hypothetical protein EOP06_06065 [Pseudomonadota bacterium]